MDYAIDNDMYVILNIHHDNETDYMYPSSEHAGFSLKEEIKKHLDETGVEYVDVGCYSPERFDYAISAQKACDKVVSDFV